MPTDPLDQLAAPVVPPLPTEFDEQLHARLNRSLLVGHLVELAIVAFPLAARHFAYAVAGWIGWTLRGAYPREDEP
jgi:hypothetical protein